MALFGSVCKYLMRANRDSFIALIEVRSRKNGKPRLIVYGAFCLLPSFSVEDGEPEDPQFIYTECIDMRNAEVVFGEYRRGVISRFSHAPHGFRRFMDCWVRDIETETFFYFPRWTKKGKKSGQRRGVKVPKTLLQLEFGNPHQILALRQRELMVAQNLLRNNGVWMSHEEKCTMDTEIAYLEREVKIARLTLKHYVASQHESKV
ncbi:MAG: hypothetical protein HZB12_00055 [Candidatus Yonathbacteria bacterium]|nr:hypothetical protein [Candidatus Yonathbacteria bacterium]